MGYEWLGGRMDWKILIRAWAIMFVINSVGGAIIGALFSRPTDALLTTSFVFLIGGYYAYNAAPARKGMHVLLSIVSYYIILLLVIFIIVLITQHY